MNYLFDKIVGTVGHNENWNNEIVYKSSFPQKFQVQTHSRKSGQLACRHGI